MSNELSKQKATMEDLAQGIGKVKQARGTETYELGKVAVPYGVSNLDELKAVDVSNFSLAKLYTELDTVEYIYDLSDTSGVPSDHGGYWVERPPRTSETYNTVLGASYVSANSFRTFGDQTSQLLPGVVATLTSASGELVEGVIITSTFDGTTTLTVINAVVPEDLATVTVSTSADELTIIARANNELRENVLEAATGVAIAANITLLYVPEQETTYGKPAEVPDSAVIVSIVGNVLETDTGTYTLDGNGMQYVVPTLQGLILSTSLSLGKRVATGGYNTVGDGGANDYIVVAAGTGVADGGSFIDTASGKQLQALFTHGLPNANQWGAFPDYNRSTKTGTDSTIALVNYAAYVDPADGVFILQPSEQKNLGYYTIKVIKLWNIRKYQSNGTAIFVRSTLFTDDWVLEFQDSTGNYTSLNGDLDYDFIDVYDADLRGTLQHGIIIRKTRMGGGDIRARQFNGTGVKFAPVFDSCIGQVDVQHSGNLTDFALVMTGDGDETNAVTIAGIVVHDCYHKVASISGSKNVIERCHFEANNVITLDDGTTGLESGLTYTNYAFSLTSGSIASLDFNDNSSTSTGWNGFCGDGVTPALDVPPSVSIKLSAANIQQINAKEGVFSFNNEDLTPYSELGLIRGDSFYGSANFRCTIGSVIVDFLQSLSDQCSISGGSARTLGNCHASLSNVTVTNELTIATTAEANRYNCTFNGGVSAVGTNYVDFDKCKINGDLSLTTASERGRFHDCKITGDVVLSGTKDIEFHRGRVYGDYTQAFTSNQNVITNGLACSGAVAGWSLPSGAVNGSRINRMDDVAVGDAFSWIWLGTWRADGIRQ